jgi:hypothetical protein
MFILLFILAAYGYVNPSMIQCFGSGACTSKAIPQCDPADCIILCRSDTYHRCDPLKCHVNCTQDTNNPLTECPSCSAQCDDPHCVGGPCFVQCEQLNCGYLIEPADVCPPGEYNCETPFCPFVSQVSSASVNALAPYSIMFLMILFVFIH